MKTPYKKLLSLIACLGIATAHISAATLCKQTFTLYGKSRGDFAVLVYHVFVSGECGNSDVQVLFLFPDRVVELPRVSYQGTWLAEWFANDRAGEPFDTCKDSAGVFYVKDSAFIRPPEPDSMFIERFGEMINSSGNGAHDWYRWCKHDCVDEPVFSNVEADLFWYTIDGVYKNYKIKEAFFFAESSYLLIITDQPVTAVGDDTMHGMMLYKLKF